MQDWLLLRSTMEMMVCALHFMEMELQTRVRTLRPTTWPSCGTCPASSCVKTMVMVWVPAIRDHLQAQHTTPEEIISPAFG